MSDDSFEFVLGPAQRDELHPRTLSTDSPPRYVTHLRRLFYPNVLSSDRIRRIFFHFFFVDFFFAFGSSFRVLRGVEQCGPGEGHESLRKTKRVEAAENIDFP